MRARELDRLDAVAGLQRRIAMRLEQVVEELHVELVVFDDQHRLRHGRPFTALVPIRCVRISKLAAVIREQLAREHVDETQTRSGTGSRVRDMRRPMPRRRSLAIARSRFLAAEPGAARARFWR